MFKFNDKDYNFPDDWNEYYEDLKNWIEGTFQKLINIIDRLANKDNELERRIKALEDTINNS